MNTGHESENEKNIKEIMKNMKRNKVNAQKNEYE